MAQDRTLQICWSVQNEVRWKEYKLHVTGGDCPWFAFILIKYSQTKVVGGKGRSELSITPVQADMEGAKQSQSRNVLIEQKELGYWIEEVVLNYC